MDRQLKYFLMDLIDYLKEDANNAKQTYLKNKNKRKSAFYEGVLHGYWEIFDTLKQHLLSFQINTKEVKFDFDPDKEFIIARKKMKKKLKTRNKT